MKWSHGFILGLEVRRVETLDAKYVSRIIGAYDMIKSA